MAGMHVGVWIHLRRVVVEGEVGGPGNLRESWGPGGGGGVWGSQGEACMLVRVRA